MQFETLATGYGLLEGPRTDDQNRLYYSDVRGGVNWIWTCRRR